MQALAALARHWQGLEEVRRGRVGRGQGERHARREGGSRQRDGAGSSDGAGRRAEGRHGGKIRRNDAREARVQSHDASSVFPSRPMWLPPLASTRANARRRGNGFGEGCGQGGCGSSQGAALAQDGVTAGAVASSRGLGGAVLRAEDVVKGGGGDAWVGLEADDSDRAAEDSAGENWSVQGAVGTGSGVGARRDVHQPQEGRGGGGGGRGRRSVEVTRSVSRRATTRDQGHLLIHARPQRLADLSKAPSEDRLNSDKHDHAGHFPGTVAGEKVIASSLAPPPFCLSTLAGAL